MRNGVAALLLISLAAVIALGVPAECQESWARLQGIDNSEGAPIMIGTSDGGFMYVCSSSSGCDGCCGAWCVKLDGSGAITWQKRYGNYQHTHVHALCEVSGGGYVFAGESDAFGSSPDIIVFKLDASGSLVWQRSCGKAGIDRAYAVLSLENGEVMVAGSTEQLETSTEDLLAMRLDASGNVLWQKVLGKDRQDIAWSMARTQDRASLIAGYTSSWGQGGFDFWVLNMDDDGNVLWQKAYGGKRSEDHPSVKATSDGGFILTGAADSFGNEESSAWVLKLSSSGEISWQKYIGGWSYERGSDIEETLDGGFAVLGDTYSYGAGYDDIWVFRLDASGHILWQKTYGGKGGENASSFCLAEDGNILVAGAETTFYYDFPNAGVWLLKLDPEGNIGPGCSFIGESGADSLDSWALSCDTDAVPREAGLKSYSVDLHCWSPEPVSYLQCYSDQALFVTGAEAVNSPFRIRVAGAGFQQGARVLINGVPAPSGTAFKGSELVVGKKGAALKAMCPAEIPVRLRVQNPDGSFSNDFPFTRGR